MSHTIYYLGIVEIKGWGFRKKKGSKVEENFPAAGIKKVSEQMFPKCLFQALGAEGQIEWDRKMKGVLGWVTGTG